VPFEGNVSFPLIYVLNLRKPNDRVAEILLIYKYNRERLASDLQKLLSNFALITRNYLGT